MSYRPNPPSSTASPEAAPGSEQRLRTVLAGVGHRYELVVIDCPPSLGEMTRNALHAASQALVVTEPGYFALRGAQQAVEAIDLVRESSNRTLAAPTIVLNRMRSTVAEHRHPRARAPRVLRSTGQRRRDPPSETPLPRLRELECRFTSGTRLLAVSYPNASTLFSIDLFPGGMR